MDRLYIVLPAYNEEDAIEKVVLSWYECLSFASEGSRIVVADSGSKDHTHDILLSIQKTHPKLVILDNKLTTHGPKLIALYKYAIDSGADFIFQTDSDGQTNPSEFEAFWKKRNQYDALMGFRRKRGDGFARKIVEKVVCILLRLYFGVSVPDANAPFRLMKAEAVGKYMHMFREDYNLPNIMLTTFFAYYGDRLAFKEISFGARKTGKNSINIPKIVKIGWKALSDFRAFKKKMKQSKRK